MRKRSIVLGSVVTVAIVALAIVAFAGWFSNYSVFPDCGGAGDVFTYSVRYNLDPGDLVPVVTVHIYIQSALLTSVTLTKYNHGELWADYHANVQLDQASNDYKYKFTSTNGDQSLIYDGPVVKENRGDCP